MTPRHLRPVSPTEANAPQRRAWVIGPVSLFIAATAVFCLTCLLYLWQDSQITTASQRIARLTLELSAAQATNQALSMRALTLQSQSRIETEATSHYRMQPVPEPQVQWVPISLFRSASPAALAAAGLGGQASAQGGAPTRAATRAGGANHSLLASWWQAAGHALAALFR
jgi:hypothetical protein